MDIRETIIAFFAKLIASETGIVYLPENFYQLEARLADAAKQLEFASVEALYESSKSHLTAQAKLLILDLATNNETLFFRDSAVFAAVEEIVTRPENLNIQGRPLRIWSAACSTGQEVYSLAMLFDKLGSKMQAPSYEILATDISERVLAHAEKGHYNQLQVQRGLSAQQLVHNFRQVTMEDGSFQWEVRENLRQHIEFRRLNLLDSFAKLGNFDLILCRNVLIYQSTEGKKDIVRRLHACLNPGGFLILGAAESLLGLNDDLVLSRVGEATAYQKRKV